MRNSQWELTRRGRTTGAVVRVSHFRQNLLADLLKLVNSDNLHEREGQPCIESLRTPLGDRTRERRRERGEGVDRKGKTRRKRKKRTVSTFLRSFLACSILKSSWFFPPPIFVTSSTSIYPTSWSSVKNFFRVPLGWIELKIFVMSLPAFWSRTFVPPGWRGGYGVGRAEREEEREKRDRKVSFDQAGRGRQSAHELRRGR